MKTVEEYMNSHSRPAKDWKSGHVARAALFLAGDYNGEYELYTKAIWSWLKINK